MIELWTPEREVERVRNLPPPCCVLVEDTLFPEIPGDNQEVVAVSRHD